MIPLRTNISLTPKGLESSLGMGLETQVKSRTSTSEGEKKNNEQSITLLDASRLHTEESGERTSKSQGRTSLQSDGSPKENKDLAAEGSKSSLQDSVSGKQSKLPAGSRQSLKSDKAIGILKENLSEDALPAKPPRSSSTRIEKNLEGG